MKKIISLFILLGLSNVVLGCSEDGSSGFLPDNDLYIPASIKRVGGISEVQFNNVIDKVETLYAPIVSSKGGRLSINRKWDDGTVNANASRLGFAWKVNMYGGLARHAAVTEDGFTLVLCHELGHHLGGAPKTLNLFGLNGWATNEGQADYFSSLKCLRQVFLNDNNGKIISQMNVPALLSTSCKKAHANKEDAAICIRSGMAGASVADLFAALRNKPAAQFDTPDTNVVVKTDHTHPAHQCRLDTFFQGALCEVSMNEDVSQSDEVKGTCHNSLGHTNGLRPRCWFKPAK
jgi:hypothetical protein